MKRIRCIALLALSALTLAPLAPAAAQNLLWTRQIGTTAWDEGHGVAVDSAGNAYIAGVTSGSLGGPNAGRSDYFLAKYDASGTLLWTRQAGTSTNDFGLDVDVDSAGNAYITGWTEGSLGGPNAGGKDVFLAKYDALGTLLWTRQAGTSVRDEALGVAVDSAGNAYITGGTGGSLGGPNPGRDDYFLAKHDTSGALLWTRQAGTSAIDAAWSVAVDSAGNAYITGLTEGSLGGPNAGLGRDYFLAKYGEAPCYADCDPNGVLDIFDFLCFQNSFVLGEPYACDCDPDPACDIFDFLCFQNAFVGGCP